MVHRRGFAELADPPPRCGLPLTHSFRLQSLFFLSRSQEMLFFLFFLPLVTQWRERCRSDIYFFLRFPFPVLPFSFKKKIFARQLCAKEQGNKIVFCKFLRGLGKPFTSNTHYSTAKMVRHASGRATRCCSCHARPYPRRSTPDQV